MPEWINDVSSNRLKNTYIQDLNNTGFALDVSGNIVVRNEYGLQFQNKIAGSFIGRNFTSNILDASNSIVIGSNCRNDRFKQWKIVDENRFNNISSIVSTPDKSVALNQDTILYSLDDGYNWNSIDNSNNFVYDDYKIGFKKMRIYRNTPSDDEYTLSFNEIQIWMNLDGSSVNVAPLSESIVKYPDDLSPYDTSFITDDNIYERDVNTNTISVETPNVSNAEILITLDKVYQTLDIQSIVIYSRISKKHLMKGVKIDFIDSNERIFFQQEINDLFDYYRFDGSKISDYHASDSSFNFTGQSTTGIIDSNAIWSFDTIRIKRGILFKRNYDLNINEIQVWKYEDNLSKNDTLIKSIRFEYIGSTPNELILTELQVWKDNTNILGVIDINNADTYISASKFQDFREENVADGLFGLSERIKVIADSSGDLFLNIDFENSIPYSDIQSVVVYNLYDHATLEDMQLQLIDESNNTFYSHNFDNTLIGSSTNIYRFDGLSLHTYDASFSYDPSDSLIFDYDSNFSTYTNDQTTVDLNLAYIPLRTYDLSNVALGATSSNITLNDKELNGSWINIPASNITDFYDISFSQPIPLDSLHSVIIYCLPRNSYTFNGAIGATIQLLNNDQILYQYDINENLGIKYAYRFDAYVSSNFDNFTNDISNVEQFGDSYNFGQERIIYGDNVSISKIVADINIYTINPYVSFWNTLNKIIYNYDNNQYLAIGDRTTAVSTNGIDWVAYSFDLANGGFDQNWVSAAYYDGKYVIIADNFSIDDPFPKQSLDGINWTPFGSNNSDFIYWNKFQYIDGSWNVFGYQETDTSFNHFSYELKLSNLEETFKLINTTWQRIVYGNGAFVVSSSSGDYRLMSIPFTSTSTWNIINTSNNLNLNNPWRDFIFGGGLFVLVAYNTVVISTNGTNWSRINVLNNKNWLIARYVNNLFFIFAEYDVAISSNGQNWVTYSLSYIQGKQWTDIIYSNDVYVAVSNSSDNSIIINDAILKDNIQLGNFSSAEFDNSVAIGTNAICTAPNQITLGNNGSVVNISKSVISQY